jgi:hypothetical protein
VNRPVVRYRASRRFLLPALAAIAGCGFSLWTGLRWSHIVWPGPAWLAHLSGALPWIAAAGFALSAALILALVLRPSIQIFETHLQIGRRTIPWTDVRRVDQTGWNVPLILHLTLENSETLRLIYAGDLDSCGALLRHLRRHSRNALLDGVPYREFWGEHAIAASAASAPAASAPKQLPPPRYRLLPPEEEEEVERLFQRLKSAGHLDRAIDKTSSDD